MDPRVTDLLVDYGQILNLADPRCNVVDRAGFDVTVGEQLADLIIFFDYALSGLRTEIITRMSKIHDEIIKFYIPGATITNAKELL